MDLDVATMSRTHHRSPEPRHRDGGLSAIVGEILMVALALALVAGAWLFFSGFLDIADEDDVPDDAVRATTADRDGDGRAEWIRLVLVETPRGSFPTDLVGVSLTRTDTGDTHTASDTTPLLCTEPVATAGTGSQPPAVCDGDARNFLHSATSDRWAEGGVLYVPCQGDEDTIVTVTLDGTAVLDAQVGCEQAAA